MSYLMCFPVVFCRERNMRISIVRDITAPVTPPDVVVNKQWSEQRPRINWTAEQEGRDVWKNELSVPAYSIDPPLASCWASIVDGCLIPGQQWINI